jgi:hypothetical protein
VPVMVQGVWAAAVAMKGQDEAGGDGLEHHVIGGSAWHGKWVTTADNEATITTGFSTHSKRRLVSLICSFWQPLPGWPGIAVLLYKGEVA